MLRHCTGFKDTLASCHLAFPLWMFFQSLFQLLCDELLNELLLKGKGLRSVCLNSTKHNRDHMHYCHNPTSPRSSRTQYTRDHMHYCHDPISPRSSSTHFFLSPVYVLHFLPLLCKWESLVVPLSISPFPLLL